MLKRTASLLLLALVLVLPNALASEVSAIERGGTVIARFTDDWIDKHSMQEIFSFDGLNLTDDELIRRDLKDSLSESEFESFMSAYEKDSKAEITVNTVAVEPATGEMLVMSSRRIDGAQYVVIRPAGKVRNSYKITCTVGKTHKSRDGFAGEYLSTPMEAADAEEVKLKIGDSKAKNACSYEWDGISIDVLDTKWGGVAVLHVPEGVTDEYDTRLYIGSDTDGIPLSGYPDNGEIVYCCMLTDTEFDSLNENAVVKIGESGSLSDVSGPFSFS